MSHEPCTPVRHFEHPVKLMGADALLAGAEKVIGQQPFAQGNVAVLEDRPNRHRELLAASRTLPHAGAHVLALLGSGRGEPVGVIHFAAMWADRTIRPAELFDILSGRVL